MLQLLFFNIKIGRYVKFVRIKTNTRMNFSCHAIYQSNLIFRSAFRLCRKSTRLTFPLDLICVKSFFNIHSRVLCMYFLLRALAMLQFFFSFLFSALCTYRQCCANVFESVDTVQRGERTRLGCNDKPLCREQRVLMNEFFLPSLLFSLTGD